MEGYNIFKETGEVLVVPGELRFPRLDELTTSPAKAGFIIEHVYGGWKRGSLTGNSQVMVFIARQS